MTSIKLIKFCQSKYSDAVIVANIATDYRSIIEYLEFNKINSGICRLCYEQMNKNKYGLWRFRRMIKKYQKGKSFWCMTPYECSTILKIKYCLQFRLDILTFELNKKSWIQKFYCKILSITDIGK